MTMYTQILIHSVYMYSRSGRTNARLATSGDQKPIEKPPIYRHKYKYITHYIAQKVFHKTRYCKQQKRVV